jgi:hypothetical protein
MINNNHIETVCVLFVKVRRGCDRMVGGLSSSICNDSLASPVSLVQMQITIKL